MQPILNMICKYTTAAVLTVALLSGLFAAGCAADVPAVPSIDEKAAAAEFAEAGKQIYAENCAKCHGIDGQGGKSIAVVGSGSNLSKFNDALALFQYIGKHCRNRLGNSQIGSATGQIQPGQAFLRLAVLLLVQNGYVGSSTEITSGKLAEIKIPK